MADHRYRVLRHMQGDKDYVPGDERIAAPADVSHLVPQALKDLGPARKAARALPNKAAPTVDNKAEKPASTRGARKAAGQ